MPLILDSSVPMHPRIFLIATTQIRMWYQEIFRHEIVRPSRLLCAMRSSTRVRTSPTSRSSNGTSERPDCVHWCRRLRELRPPPLVYVIVTWATLWTFDVVHHGSIPKRVPAFVRRGARDLPSRALNPADRTQPPRLGLGPVLWAIITSNSSLILSQARVSMVFG